MIPFLDFCELLEVTLEPAQRVFWGVACDGIQPRDLTGDEREIAREIFGFIETLTPPSTVAVIKGADVGFSFIGSLRLLHRAVTAALQDAAYGEIRPALVVAPDQRLGRRVVAVAAAHAQRVPEIASTIASITSDAIIFDRPDAGDGLRTSVECLPATQGGRGTRGRRYVEALLDEASFFRDEASGAVNDADLYRSIAPRCTGTVWIGSTPWIEQGLLFDLYSSHFGVQQ